MNRNTLYSEVLVDELARSGLKAIAIAPGSRNTPLVLAFAQHPRIQVYSLLDERSAAFFALGLAMASGNAVAMLCTSGSAVANFFPAIVEAHQSRIPLLVITADRPQELRFSGANQTIDQVKIFGDYALWSVDMSLPEADMLPEAFRNIRTTANRAMSTANGIRKGVVHLNVPFRKPLEPTPVPSDAQTPPEDALPRAMNAPYTTLHHGTLALNDPQIDMLANIIETYPKGIIVCGANTPAHAHHAISMLATHAHYPIFADGTSGMRFGFDKVIGGYDIFLNGETQWQSPDVVIRFGDVPTSQPLATYLDKIQATYRIHIVGDGVWADDSHRTTHLLMADEKLACMQVLRRFETRVGSAWLRHIQAIEHATWQIISTHLQDGVYSDGQVVYDVIDTLSPNSVVFIGNSLPVRNLDQFGKPTPKRIMAYGNRGASGIDGNISTALGIAAHDPQKPLVAIVGDITFYHDMNGLLGLRRLNIPITIVLINNDGGGIFHRLPIKDYEPTFTDLFITPHGLDFAHAAHLYGLEYTLANDSTSFKSALADSVTNKKMSVIEVKTDAKQDLAKRKRMIEAVKAIVREIAEPIIAPDETD
jgi:2-succinyl-5-enolpyruvyl-6-hydroxy-3-cyclohexene-1-carboxylate synthase